MFLRARRPKIACNRVFVGDLTVRLGVETTIDRFRRRRASPLAGEAPAQVEFGDSPRTMSLALAGLYGAGATIGALTLLLPHPSAFNDAALWTNVAIAYAASLALTLTAGRLPAWSLQAVVAVGTLVVTRSIYYGDPSGFYAFWYVWVGLYAFFFFGTAWGSAQTALIGLSYGWVLSQTDQSSPVIHWLLVVSTIGIGGALIDVLASRMRRRAAEAAGRAKALQAVANVAHELARRTSPESASEVICASAAEVAQATGAVLCEPTGDGKGLVMTAATDPRWRGIVIPFLAPSSGMVRAFVSAEPLFSSEAPSDPKVHKQLVERFEVESMLFQPVLHEENPVGVLGVYWDRRIERLDDELARVVNLLAVEASVALERVETLSRLERVALTDDLTGLPNRRSWDEQLQRELSRARRRGTPLTVAMLDLDHFKLYNDRHGHQAGDRFLKEAGAAWEGLIRDTDIIARYGGEEFAVGFPDTELETARELVERLRSATPEGERCSAGVAAFDGGEGADELVARADAALYEAKRGGRDRAVAAG
jgi:diguanylate cyclase (GGDEF)-like protein